MFEARVEAGTVPWCPYGCTPSFVQLVHITPPSISSERVRTATRLVREMADMQGLTDIDVSPSTPGDSVADKNFKRAGGKIQAFAGANFNQHIGALKYRANELANAGFGNRYNPHEWSTDQKTGTRRHVASPPLETLPRVPTEMTRVRGKP